MNKHVEKSVLFLNEGEYTSNSKKFIILTHDIRKEVLQSGKVTFAKAQHPINRDGNLHYFHNKRHFKEGYYK
jgi:hypothetical protein